MEEIDKCKEWLRKELIGQDFVLSSDVSRRAKEQGFTKKQLKAARKSLGVEAINDWAANGETLNWYWRLPRSEV